MEPDPSLRVLVADAADGASSSTGVWKMNSVIYLIGLVVVVLAILSFLGLR